MTNEREDSRGAAAPKDLVDSCVAIRMTTGRSTGGACSYIRLGYRVVLENAQELRFHSWETVDDQICQYLDLKEIDQILS